MAADFLLAFALAKDAHLPQQIGAQIAEPVFGVAPLQLSM
jgi:hypothetical protein